MSDALSSNTPQHDIRDSERQQRKKQADEMRKLSQRNELMQSIRSILSQVKSDNSSAHFQQTLQEGSLEEIRNESLELRRVLDVDTKMRRLSSKTSNHGVAFLKVVQPLLEGKKQIDRLQNELKQYRSGDKRDNLSPQETTALRTLVMQLRQTLQNYNLLRDQALKLYLKYSQGRRKDMGEEAALRHSTEYYLQFVDAPQRARIEIQIKEKMGDMPQERRIEALKVFIQTLVQISPSVRDAEAGRCLEMARHFRNENHIDDAIGELKKALETLESAEIYNELAECWKNKGDRAQEAEALQKSIQCQPDEIEAYLRLAQLHEEEGSLQDAVALYQKILELRPGRLSILTHAARLAFDSKLWPDAIRWYTQILSQKPKSKTTILRLGVSLIRCGQIERGLSLLQECERRGVDDGLLNLHLGIAYRAQGHHNDAHDAFAEAFQKSPNEREVLYWKALSDFETGEYEEAERLCRSLLSSKKTDSGVTLLLGRILNAQKRSGEALEILRPLAKSPHAGGDDLMEYGKSCMNTNQAEEAYQILHPLFKKDPANAEVREALGQACIQSGRFSEAMQYLTAS